MTSEPSQLGEQIDQCDVCEVPMEEIAEPMTTELGKKLLSFCTEKCYKQYLEDPAAYAEFEDDTVVE